jgi:hypothetical protein
MGGIGNDVGNQAPGDHRGHDCATGDNDSAADRCKEEAANCRGRL